MRQPLVTRVRLGVSCRAGRCRPLGRAVAPKALPAAMRGRGWTAAAARSRQRWPTRTTRGVVHRDMEPDHVLMSGGGARIADVGVTTSQPESSSAEQGPMPPGPSHWARRRLVGRAGECHPATAAHEDIDAVGVPSYEQLPGRPPFAGRRQNLRAALVTEPPEFSSQRRVARPRAMGALVRHCLEQRAVDRPQTAVDLIYALDQGHRADGWRRGSGSGSSRHASRVT